MKNMWISIKISLTMCIVLALGYVVVLRLVAAVAAPNNGEAEVVRIDNTIVGVEGVGQQFTDSCYFWGRPSAVDYNAAASGGSNKATTNPEYLAEVEARVEAWLVAHPYLTRAEIPSEMVTASGSGLDPDISPCGAKIQAQRIAQSRGISEIEVLRIIEECTQKPWLGLFGTSKINVLKINRELDVTKSKI